MAILDETTLRNMHPNYEQEKKAIEKVFNYFLALVNKNLIDYLADNYRIIHKKNYLFSNQPKEIYYNDGTNPNYNVNLACDYEKDGTLFQISVNSKAVIDNILPDCPFDKITITPGTQHAKFTIDGRGGVDIGYTYDGEDYILTSYSANFDILKNIM